MTYDTPHGNSEKRRWCENCQLSVEPTMADSGPECPACGGDL